MNLELYIDGQKADLTTVVSVPMNYELEKLENPTIIRNNFSKTISLEATPNNNKIFSYYYELDKVHTGEGFCANKRIPFELYRDNELIESGYLQLNNITYKSNKYVYEITLYGGLGDFFYSLAYDEEGNDKTLADLNYGYGSNDEDFTFIMNAETVINAWDGYGELLGETVTFIPSYNGIYEDFDNDKVLINLANTVFPSSVSEDEDYGPIEGFAMATLENEMTEWQIRDLRSYKQRPGLRLKSFIEAICKPENNGGYEVELDEKYFFNQDNPYYDRAWIALPLLNPDSEEWVESKNKISVTSSSKLDMGLYVGTKSTSLTLNNNNNLVNQFGGNSSIDIDCDFSLTSTTISTETVLLQCKGGKKPIWTGIGVWLEAQVNGTTIGYSNCVVLTKGMYLNKKDYTIPDISKFDGSDGFPNTNYNYYDGYFVNKGLASFEWAGQLADGNETSGDFVNTFRLTLRNVPNYKGLTVKLNVAKWQNKNAYYEQKVTNPWGGTDKILTHSPYLYTSEGKSIIPNGISVSNIVYPSAIVNINSNRKTLQNAIVTKRQLLKNKITPSSLLLSYTKLFGLYFVKDIDKKKIKILTKNTFFENAEVIDIEDKIDYSNEVKIGPLVFDKKWYTFKCPALETTQMKNYKSNYLDVEYGQKRINTNYNFNTDVEDIYKDNQYQNVITILDSSKYYRNFKDKNGGNAPTFGIDGCKYKLWLDTDIISSKEFELAKRDIINIYADDAQTPFGTLAGADAFPKLCCFDLDNDKQSLNDLSVTLVFDNYTQYPTDVNGNTIWYTVSDDHPLMSTINDGKPMYLFANYEYDENGEQICYRTQRIPQFTRYDIVNGKIINSFDFGVPYETYINANYPEQSTLYNQYWKNFYNDQFSDNTRKVVAYVKFKDIKLGNHSLSNFYYFNNCYWLLNKIIDYDLANPQKKVKCEFIKINNTANYVNGQNVVIPWFEWNIERDNISDFDLITLDTRYGGEIKFRFKPYNGIKTLTIDMKGVSQEEIRKRYTLIEEQDGYNLFTLTNITGEGYIYISGWDNE